jgi:hypothetical protein
MFNHYYYDVWGKDFMGIWVTSQIKFRKQLLHRNFPFWHTFEKWSLHSSSTTCALTTGTSCAGGVFVSFSHTFWSVFSGCLMGTEMDDEKWDCTWRLNLPSFFFFFFRAWWSFCEYFLTMTKQTQDMSYYNWCSYVFRLLSTNLFFYLP